MQKGSKGVVPFAVSEFQALKFVHFVSLRETAHFSLDQRAAPPSLAGHSGASHQGPENDALRLIVGRTLRRAWRFGAPRLHRWPGSARGPTVQS